MEQDGLARAKGQQCAAGGACPTIERGQRIGRRERRQVDAVDRNSEVRDRVCAAACCVNKRVCAGAEGDGVVGGITRDPVGAGTADGVLDDRVGCDRDGIYIVDGVLAGAIADARERAGAHIEDLRLGEA